MMEVVCRPQPARGGSAATAINRSPNDAGPDVEVDASLRSALSELLQTSGVKLDAEHAGLLVDALLSPRKGAGGGADASVLARPGDRDDAFLSDEDIDEQDATLVAGSMDGEEEDDDVAGVYNDSEDLALGVGSSGGPAASSVQRSISYPVRAGSGNKMYAAHLVGSQSSNDVQMSRSLRARLGDDLSEHLDRQWLDRHPDVAHVLDDHPELVDVMTELLRERQNLENALTNTQEEMKRRQMDHLEHARYLEELSTDQIEKARYQFAARQAEVLKNVTVEIDPDDVAERMAKELQEKEAQMQRLIEQQNKLKEELAAKDQLHSERSRQYDESQLTLKQELDKLKSQLTEAKTKSLQRRKRYGGSISRPSSMLLEQLSHLAVEKTDEAEKLRQELLAMQQKERDRADVEHYRPLVRSATGDSMASSLAASEAGSIMYDYGLDARDLTNSGRPSSRTPRRLPSPGMESEEEVPSVVDRFLSANPHGIHYPEPNHVAVLKRSPPPPPRARSPLSMDYPPTPESSLLSPSASTPPVAIRSRAKPAPELVTPSTLADEIQQVDSAANTPMQENGSGSLDDGNNSPGMAFPMPNTSSTRERNSVAGRFSASERFESSSGPSLLPVPQGLGRVHRSKSCPKLDSIVEIASIRVATASGSQADVRGATAASAAAQPQSPAVLKLKQCHVASGEDAEGFSDKAATAKEFRSHSYAGCSELGMSHRDVATAISTISWQPVGGMSRYSSPSPVPYVPPSSLAANRRDSGNKKPGRKSPAGWTSSTGEVQSFNVAVLGASGVGKTSFVRDFGRGSGASQPTDWKPPTSTVGMDFVVCSASVSGVDVTLKVWDTAGAERFLSLTQSYLRRCDGVVLMFDVGNRGSLLRIKTWYNEVMKSCPDDVVVLMVGNKVDCAKTLPQEDVVRMDEAMAVAQEINSAMYMEASAIEGYGVSEACSIITTAMLARYAERGARPQPSQDSGAIELEKEDTSRCCPFS